MDPQKKEEPARSTPTEPAGLRKDQMLKLLEQLYCGDEKSPPILGGAHDVTVLYSGGDGKVEQARFQTPTTGPISFSTEQSESGAAGGKVDESAQTPKQITGYCNCGRVFMGSQGDEKSADQLPGKEPAKAEDQA